MQAVQEEICASVEIAFLDQSYTGKATANETREHRVKPRVAKQPQALHLLVDFLTASFAGKSAQWGRHLKA